MRDYKNEYEQHIYKKRMSQVNADKRGGCLKVVIGLIALLVIIAMSQ